MVKQAMNWDLGADSQVAELCEENCSNCNRPSLSLTTVFFGRLRDKRKVFCSTCFDAIATRGEVYAN